MTVTLGHYDLHKDVLEFKTMMRGQLVLLRVYSIWTPQSVSDCRVCSSPPIYSTAMHKMCSIINSGCLWYSIQLHCGMRCSHAADWTNPLRHWNSGRFEILLFSSDRICSLNFRKSNLGVITVCVVSTSRCWHTQFVSCNFKPQFLQLRPFSLASCPPASTGCTVSPTSHNCWRTLYC